MRNDRPVNDISDLGGNRYPHFKLTAEPFPRILATRRIEDDGDEYYGAFLTKTSVRILIDFLNRTFKLRSCDIPIDGSFPMPCTQFYRRRCVAPCVSRLCAEDEYLERVGLVRLFISNQRGSFRAAVSAVIEDCSKQLNFERAAVFRDILQAVEKFWKDDRLQIWLDDAADTYVVEDTYEGCNIFLVTHRGRNVLGRKVFTVPRDEFESPDEAFAKLINSFYLYHLPKEIRVSRDFFGRAELAKELTARFGRPARISVADPKTRAINAYRGLMLSHDEHELDRAKPSATPEVISSKLETIFGLGYRPERIEAFDAAHISGTGFVAASAVWENGHFLSTDYQFILSQEKSELATLADGVRRTLEVPNRKRPDIILLDGGKSQLNSVMKNLSAGRIDVPAIIAAVKPPGKHGSIASFLRQDGDTILFDVDSPAHATLQLLRDEAHDLANRIHRDYREMVPFYEAEGFDKPLIVPIRFHAENGGAEDLIPIEAR